MQAHTNTFSFKPSLGASGLVCQEQWKHQLNSQNLLGPLHVQPRSVGKLRPTLQGQEYKGVCCCIYLNILNRKN